MDLQFTPPSKKSKSVFTLGAMLYLLPIPFETTNSKAVSEKTAAEQISCRYIMSINSPDGALPSHFFLPSPVGALPHVHIRHTSFVNQRQHEAPPIFSHRRDAVFSS
jgi:hypothetical protein